MIGIVDNSYAFSLEVQKINNKIQYLNSSFEYKMKLIDEFNKYCRNTKYKKMYLSCDIKDWKSNLDIKFDKIKVSIILPIYNKAEYGLIRALQACVTQTHNNIEIICVNDASTDNSLEIVTYYAKNDNRIKIIDLKKNRKCAGARIAGWEVATGDYIVNVDPDDWIDIDYVKEVLYTATTTGLDIVEFETHIDDFHKTEKDLVYYGSISDAMFASQKGFNSELKIFVWGKIYKKSIVDKAIVVLKEKTMVNFAEDVLLNTYLLQFAETIGKVSITSQYHYELNNDSITKNFNLQKAIESSYVFNTVCHEFNNYYTHEMVSCIMSINKSFLRELDFFTEKEMFATMDKDLLAILLNFAYKRLDEKNYENSIYKRYKLHKIVKIVERIMPYGSIRRDLAKIMSKLLEKIYKFVKNIYNERKPIDKTLTK